MSASAAFTPGPWEFQQPDSWPFDLLVMAGDDEILSQRRWASSSQQRSLADCLDAVGFDHSERPGIIAVLQRQIATLRLIAAAPDLLAALQQLHLKAVIGTDAERHAALDQAWAAITKATGDA